jgi:hypothetical protein
MGWLREPDPSGAPRVLMVSQRARSPQQSRSLRFDFEDLVQTLDTADLVAPDRPTVPWRLMRRASSVLDNVVPGSSDALAMDRPRLAPRYELVFVAVESMHDLQLMQPFSWLLRRARISVCLVDELWKKGFRQRTGEIPILRLFDRVFVSTAGSVEEVAEVTGRPCSYLAPSVDALALCPYPRPARRVIDVYSMGRRSPDTHGALLEFAERNGWFYLYDTVGGVTRHREHRRHLASILRRTRYLLAYPGKMDVPGQTGGQQEIGFRYFEGAAAGTLLVGEAPSTPWFEKLFGWPDSTIHLPYGATDVSSCLLTFDSDPERAERVRRTNVAQSLLRHDHVYRWSQVLQHVGLPETPSMEARRRELQERAASIAQPTRPVATASAATGSDMPVRSR